MLQQPKRHVLSQLGCDIEDDLSQIRDAINLVGESLHGCLVINQFFGAAYT